MDSQPPSILSQIRDYYSEKGLLSLIKASGEKPLHRLIKYRSVGRTELKELAGHNDRLWIERPEESITISPISHSTLRRAFESYPKQYTPDQPFVCEIKQGHLLGPHAVGLTKNGRVIEETFSGVFPRMNGWGRQKPNLYKRTLGIENNPAPVHEKSVVFPLISEYHSYYHWVVEYLPKLRLLEYYKNETGVNPTILIESNPRKFVRESLSLAGYGPDQYQEWTGDERRVERLVVPIHRTHRFDYQNPKNSNYNPSRTDLKWVRKRMRSNVTFNSDDEKIIYISRQETPPDRGRKVVNYDEVREIIRNIGGDTYTLEEMNFKEQVELFSEADMIIGPHGAGLLNMIFADDPVVVELFPETVLKPHFYFISDMLGFEYEPFISQAESEDLIIDKESFSDHITSLQDK